MINILQSDFYYLKLVTLQPVSAFNVLHEIFLFFSGMFAEVEIVVLIVFGDKVEIFLFDELQEIGFCFFGGCEAPANRSDPCEPFGSVAIDILSDDCKFLL